MTEIYENKKQLATMAVASAAITLTIASCAHNERSDLASSAPIYTPVPTIETFQNRTAIELPKENEDAPPQIIEQELAPPPQTEEIEITPEPSPIIIPEYEPPKAEPTLIPTIVPTRVPGGELSPITGYYCQYVPGYPRGDGGGYCKVTASGKVPQSGMAACGSKWALGTTLFIEGYGSVVCEDRGNLQYNQVDIFFSTNAELYTTNFPTRAVVR